MKMFIPTVGTKIKLTSSWCFSLYRERRNDGLIKAFLLPETNSWNDYGNKIQDVTLPEGTILKVARVYIRGTARDFDSITFTIDKKASKLFFKPKGAIRFWAKLADVNKIEYELVDHKDRQHFCDK